MPVQYNMRIVSYLIFCIASPVLASSAGRNPVGRPSASEDWKPVIRALVAAHPCWSAAKVEAEIRRQAEQTGLPVSDRVLPSQLAIRKLIQHDRMAAEAARAQEAADEERSAMIAADLAAAMAEIEAEEREGGDRSRVHAGDEEPVVEPQSAGPSSMKAYQASRRKVRDLILDTIADAIMESQGAEPNRVLVPRILTRLRSEHGLVRTPGTIERLLSQVRRKLKAEGLLLD